MIGFWSGAGVSVFFLVWLGWGGLKDVVGGEVPALVGWGLVLGLVVGEDMLFKVGLGRMRWRGRSDDVKVGGLAWGYAAKAWKAGLGWEYEYDELRRDNLNMCI